MTDTPIDPRYAELRAELEALRAKLTELESRPASRRGSVRKRAVLMISLAVASAIVGVGGLTATGVIEPFYIDDQGVHIRGRVRIQEADCPSCSGVLELANGNKSNTVSTQPDGTLRLDSAAGVSASKLQVVGDLKVYGAIDVGRVKAESFVGKLDGKVDVANVEGLDARIDNYVRNRILSNYNRYPKPDFERDVAVKLSQYNNVCHNWSLIPSKVEVWVKSDGTKDVSGLKNSDQWKMSGILSLWESGASHGVVIEEIGVNCIWWSTGNGGLHHSTREGSYFRSGVVRIRAWK